MKNSCLSWKRRTCLVFEVIAPIITLFMLFKLNLKWQRVRRGMRTSLPLAPPSSSLPLIVWRSVKHLTLITASQRASPRGVAWAKSTSVLSPLITALHHHLCPSLSSLSLYLPAQLHAFSWNDPTKNICDETR